MERKRQIAMAVFAALTLAALVFVGIDRDGALETRTVYAQGEYVRALEGVSSPFADVAEVVMPCVVGVSNRANTYSIVSGQTELVEQATGSGVVVTTEGHVVTNYHVVEGASDVQVLWQGQYLSAEIVGVDELTDLAVLRVTEDVALPAVQMGDPADADVGGIAHLHGRQRHILRHAQDG